MTAPVRPDTTSRIFTGEEWEAASYAPHRAGNDPTKPMPAGRVLTGDEWEKAHASGSIKALTLPALPKFAADMTRTAATPDTKGTPLAAFDIRDPSTYVTPILRQVINPALEHPGEAVALGIAPFAAAGASPLAGLAVGGAMAGTMVYNIGRYGWQKAHELSMSPEDRAKAEADPNRISGESAAMQAIMLGLGPLIHVGVKAARADFGAGMMESGAQALRPLYFESPKGAEVLGTAAARHGLPETASPYPPESPLAVAWKEGHAQASPVAGESPRVSASTEAPTPIEPVAGPNYKGPVSLYKRLSDDALGAEYRALIEKRTQEEPNAIAPVWDAEREARAVEQIENRRRPDGSLAPADKRRLAYLQMSQGEGYGEGRHTFETAAAERRVNDMNKHIAAIEKEIANRGKTPESFMQAPIASGEGQLQPIEGVGETKTRGLSLSVEQKAVANDLTDYLGDLPEYRTMNMADQAMQSSKLLAENPDLARKIALGDEPAPKGLAPEAVFKAVEDKAILEGDVATIRDLANGRLPEQATTMGQRLRTLAERDPDSPVTAIQKISDARGMGKDVRPVIMETVAELKTHIEKSMDIPPEQWQAFIDSIRC